MIRSCKHSRAIFCALIMLPLCSAAASADCYPMQLKCEYVENPLAVDAALPRFSWEIESHRRGERQTAYQIVVASSREKLAANEGDKWDSGRVESSQSVNVSYAGKPLSTRERCYWKVRVWDRDKQPSAPSDVATFEMALLKPSDWSAKWVSASRVLPFVDGRDGRGLNLDGTTQTVRISHEPRLKPSAGLSLSAWVKPGEALGSKARRDTSDWREIYRKEDGNGRHVLAIGDGAIAFGIGIDGQYAEAAAPVSYPQLKDGAWHLITATYDGKTQRIFLDGAEVGHSDRAGRLETTGSRPAYIGSSDGQKEFFPGGIDDLRIYDRALSADEVQKLSHGEGPQNGLVSHWKLDGNLSNNLAGTSGEALGATSGAPLLRSEFAVQKPVRRARAAISGLGWFELYLNGQRVGDHVLDPVTSNYDKKVYYVTHDIGDYLQNGRNVIGITLGNGWFSQPGTYRYAKEPVLIGQIDVEYTDGTHDRFVTDERWKTSSGPITYNAIQRGEFYDARLEKSGWTDVGYEDVDWTPATVVSGPSGALCSQMLPPMRVVADLAPVSLSEPQPGVFIFDLGQVFGGWTRLHVRGEAGTQVTLKYSERLMPETGLLDKRNHPVPDQTDIYTLKGDSAGEVFEPRFTFHPVRFIQIEGYPGKPTLNDLVGRVVRSDVDMAGGFSTSNPLINRIAHLNEWTVKSSWFGEPIDCLHREPFPYLEPAETPSHLYMRKFMPQFWIKWLNDIPTEQKPDGSIPVVIPNYPRHTSIDPAWSGNYPIAIWYFSQCYEDHRILEEHYAPMERWMEHLATVAKDHLILKGTWGDHMSPGPVPGEEDYLSPIAPPPYLWTGIYFRDAEVMSQIADQLGKKDDAARYAKLADEIKKAINAKWFDAATANYAGGAQTCNAFALALDIVPADKKEAVTQNLLRDLGETNQGKLTTGIMGLTSLVEMIADQGGGDLFYRVLNRTEYPGWGYMIGHGATTLWESWGQIMPKIKRGREECMAMFSTVQEFFYSDIGGVHGPDFYGPRSMPEGFANARIRPQALGDLERAETSIRTVRGMVTSRWRREGPAFVLEAVIPGNSRGTVSIPIEKRKKPVIKESGTVVWQDGKFLSGVEGITAGKSEPGYITFEVGSGDYEFHLSGS